MCQEGRDDGVGVHSSMHVDGDGDRRRSGRLAHHWADDRDESGGCAQETIEPGLGGRMIAVRAAMRARRTATAGGAQASAPPMW